MIENHILINNLSEYLPQFENPKEFTNSNDYLRYIAMEGLAKRYSKEKETGSAKWDAAQKRLEYELGIIIQMDFSGYFLIVADYVNWAREHDIPVGPGRGSGASSTVAYALRITDIDPLKYDLLFERFINPERLSIPDFDIDFGNEGRDKVMEYVTGKYDRGGLVKFGFLRLGILDVIRHTEEQIRRRGGEYAHFSIENIPEDDAATLIPALKALLMKLTGLSFIRNR